MALVRSQGTIRVYRHQDRAIALGFLRTRPEMQIRRNRITTPDQDQLGVLELFEIGPDPRADRISVTGTASGSANRAVQQGCPELVQETRRHRFTLHQAHGAGIAIRQNRLRIARRNRAQASGYRIDCLIPTDAGEFPLALVADPFHRIQQAVFMVSPLGVTRYLGA